jgi:hypothetical protein
MKRQTADLSAQLTNRAINRRCPAPFLSSPDQHAWPIGESHKIGLLLRDQDHFDNAEAGLVFEAAFPLFHSGKIFPEERFLTARSPKMTKPPITSVKATMPEAETVVVRKSAHRFTTVFWLAQLDC